MADYSYAGQYLESDDIDSIREEVAKDGFMADRFARDLADVPVSGLNVSIAWPLPVQLRARYEALRSEILDLSDGLYVYPFETTHITVVTAVDFKRNMNASPETIDGVVGAAESLQAIVTEAAGPMGPFSIDVGPPVLVRSAAFFPVLNATNELLRIRATVVDACRRAGGVLADAFARPNLHCTLLRILVPPVPAEPFASQFAQIASRHRLGHARIEEILVTLETKPFMGRGQVMSRMLLR